MMLGTLIFAVAIWPTQSFTMANGILSTKEGAYIEYLPYDIFHSVAGWSVGITDCCTWGSARGDWSVFASKDTAKVGFPRHRSKRAYSWEYDGNHRACPK